MTVADNILDMLKRKRRLKLTAIDIAEMLYWEDKTYQQRVKADCLMLYEQGKLARGGKGSRADPYTYSIAPIERRPHDRKIADGCFCAKRSVGSLFRFSREAAGRSMPNPIF